GFARDDVKKVDALLVGHGHGDHMSDAPYVAMKTGAPLLGAPITPPQAMNTGAPPVGAPITTTQAQKMGLADAQLITVTGRGGEMKKFKDITVEPMLGRHGDGDAEVGAAQNVAYRQLRAAANLTRTPEQQAKARAEQAGSNDAHILDEGVISYLMTLDGTAFRII